MGKAARFGFLTPAVLSVLLGSCVEPAGAERIIGPDGTQMLHVHCGDEQVACFRVAGEMCPRGYSLSPIFDPRDGNFLVRCRDPSEPSAIANAALPAAAKPESGRISIVRTRTPDPDWPPHEVAQPSEPWPAPSAATPAPKAGISTVDLGY
jgi:hypothetical protein